MVDAKWYRCKFLESGENLKPLIKIRFGREPNSSIARDISACLQQGRLFYEAAEMSPLEIRPLQQFYGMVGFAKALVIAKNLQSLSTLKPSHGIRDVSAGNARIEELRVHIDRSGTFQEFNDVVAPLTRLCYIDNATEYRTIDLPSASSDKLDGLEITFRDILSRIPELAALYQMTFGEDSNTEQVSFEPSVGNDTEFRIRIDVKGLYSDRESLKNIVWNLRRKFPFLGTWRLNSAQLAWGRSTIYFRNTANDKLDEFSEEYLFANSKNYEERPVSNDENKPFPVADGLGPLAGGLSSGAMAVSPISGQQVSEFSFQYLALFLLSSLVRYRPQTWTHAISRSAFHEIPADDKALSLIEQFLIFNSTSIPNMIATILNPQEDEWFK